MLGADDDRDGCRRVADCHRAPADGRGLDQISPFRPELRSDRGAGAVKVGGWQDDRGKTNGGLRELTIQSRRAANIARVTPETVTRSISNAEWQRLRAQLRRAFSQRRAKCGQIVKIV